MSIHYNSTSDDLSSAVLIYTHACLICNTFIVFRTFSDAENIAIRYSPYTHAFQKMLSEGFQNLFWFQNIYRYYYILRSRSSEYPVLA